MKYRATSVLTVIGGLASASLAQTAQVWSDAAHTNPVVMHFSLTAAEYNAATMLPVPISDGIIEPGEGAFLRLSVSTTPAPTFSGTNPGTHAYWDPALVGGGAGSGWLWGIAGMFVDVVGDNGNSSAAGTWAPVGGTGNNFRGTIGAWALGDSSTMGTPTQNGARMANIQAGQFGANLLALSTADPVANIWRGLWVPTSFQARDVTFAVSNNSAGVADGAVLLADSTFPNNTIPLGANTGVSFGSAVVHFDIPAPATVVLFGLGAGGLMRRRRGLCIGREVRPGAHAEPF
jgi:hypothetical protein